MIGGALSEIDFGSATFLDYLCRSRVAKTLQVLSLRFLNSPLTCVCPQLSFSVGTLVHISIPGLIHESRTIVNLDLCCFRSRTFSPCTLVFQGCSREWLENFAFEHNLRATRVLQFSSWTQTFGNWACFEGQKTRSSVAIPAFSRFCPHGGRMISPLLSPPPSPPIPGIQLRREPSVLVGYGMTRAT